MDSQSSSMTEVLRLLGSTRIASSMTNTSRLKVAVCGKQKSGKSVLIAKTARKPLLHYDFDDRAESIAGVDDTVIKTMVDKDPNSPKVWGELNADIQMLKYSKEQPFKSICFDSMTFLRQYAENQMMVDTSLKRSIKVAGIQHQIAQGWDSINAVHKMFQQFLVDTFDLGIDVYCVFHTAQEKDRVKSTKDNVVYTDKLTIEPQNLNILLSKFNEVWRCYIDESGDFKLQIKADYYFGAATTLKGVESVETPDISRLLVKNEQVKP